MTEIIVACISAGSAIVVGMITFAGVVVTNNKANAKIEKQLEIAQAITDTKIEELTREVREHNNFAKRMPAVETEIQAIHKIIELYHKGT